MTEHFRDDERLRKAERLRDREEFLEIRRAGRRVAGPHFVVYGRTTDRAHTRLGITASRKVGKATVRNWWKRQIRESFRRNKREFPAGYDFVVIVKGSAQRGSPENLERELLDLFDQVATEHSG
ncbi:MAG: ribonuclease P protein component [Bradymonadaceae bacterium]